MTQANNHYRTLKVAADAEAEVIKAAYKALMLKYHPDQNQDSPLALAQARQINEAFSVLGDPSKRAAYDRQVAAARPFEQSQPPPFFHEPNEAEKPYPMGEAYTRPYYRSADPARAQPASGRRSEPSPRPRRRAPSGGDWRFMGVTGMALLAAGLGVFGLFHLRPQSASMTSPPRQATSALEAVKAPEEQLERVAQALRGTDQPDGEGSPRLIRIAPSRTAHRPVTQQIYIAWRQLTAPRYSAEYVGSGIVYRRSDPWFWFESQYHKIAGRFSGRSERDERCLSHPGAC